MRSVAIGLVMITLLTACARPSSPTPKAPAEPPVEAVKAPEPPAPAQPAAPAQAPAPPTLEPPARTSIPGGFRLGPIPGARALRWLGPDRVALTYQSGGKTVEAAVAVTGGELSELPPEKPLPYNGGAQMTNPSRSRVVIYGKGGAGLLINLETGAERRLEKGYWAQAGFDRWSPTGEVYLVQSVREDPVPGFYFFDPDGNLTGNFSEPGHFAMWPSWSPDGKQVAFLSVPLDVRYPRSPEEWAEVPFAPRVGILDVATGKARYAARAGQHFFGTPVWSPDSINLAAVCGDLATMKNNPPFAQNESTTLKQSRPCVIDSERLTVTLLGDPAEEPRLLQMREWAPDGSAVRTQFLVDGAGWKDRLDTLDGQPPAPVNNPTVWLQGGRMLSYAGEQLRLIDRRGGTKQLLDSGRIEGLAASPDMQRIAYLRAAGGNRYELVVIQPGEGIPSP